MKKTKIIRFKNANNEIESSPVKVSNMLNTYFLTEANDLRSNIDRGKSFIELDIDR